MMFQLLRTLFLKDQTAEEDIMYVIAGLGNPDKKYEHTRHNVGFDVIDALAAKYHIDMKEKKHKAVLGRGLVAGVKVLLVKPQTYMNLSGESVRSLVDYFKIDEEQELIIIYDDVSLDIGQLRIRKKGSAGGHNGIKNIIAHLGHQVFPRIKVGVGEKPKGYDLADYVLGRFGKEEKELMQDGYKKAAEAAEMLVRGEMEAAMNAFNKKVK